MAGAHPSTVLPITTETDFAHHTSSLPSSCLAVIYFHAPWAEPCKQMSTILSTLASTYPAETPPRIAFYSLDAEELSDVSEKYEVTQVPLVVLQKGGQTVEAITGTDAAKVRAAVEKHVPSSGGSEGQRSGLPPRQEVTRPTQSQSTHAAAGAPQTNGGAGLAKYTPDDSHTNGAPPSEDLNERLSTLVNAAGVMLFMKGTPSAPQCGFSRQTVSILREKGVKYGFFNILADDEVRQGLKEFSDWPTFPQVYVGGELVGGLDILKEELENDPDFLSEHIASSKQAVAA